MGERPGFQLFGFCHVRSIMYVTVDCCLARTLGDSAQYVEVLRSRVGYTGYFFLVKSALK